MKTNMVIDKVIFDDVDGRKVTLSAEDIIGLYRYRYPAKNEEESSKNNLSKGNPEDYMEFMTGN